MGLVECHRERNIRNSSNQTCGSAVLPGSVRLGRVPTAVVRTSHPAGPAYTAKWVPDKQQTSHACACSGRFLSVCVSSTKEASAGEEAGKRGGQVGLRSEHAHAHPEIPAPRDKAGGRREAREGMGQGYRQNARVKGARLGHGDVEHSVVDGEAVELLECLDGHLQKSKASPHPTPCGTLRSARAADHGARVMPSHLAPWIPLSSRSPSIPSLLHPRLPLPLFPTLHHLFFSPRSTRFAAPPPPPPLHASPSASSGKHCWKCKQQGWMNAIDRQRTHGVQKPSRRN